MKLKYYIKDKLLECLIYIFLSLIIFLLLLAFKVSNDLIIVVILILFILGIFLFFYSYFRKKQFYDYLISNTKNIDKKFLVLETLNSPNFYEGKLMYDIMYEINKSMGEEINNYKQNIDDFKEYIEMWIHEAKIPISALSLMYHNNKSSENNKYQSEINRLDNYIDQILYYVRSENIEKDFLIKYTKLDKVISKVALKNKNELLENNIDFNVEVNDIEVLTDSKWLEFIINQLINNSIKYKKDNINSYIKISAKENKNGVILSIYDNGIGISKNDIKKVFNKTFTGENGRIKSKSTGMGLYIAKRLCNKLGHKIKIDSIKGDYTEVVIEFQNNDFYNIKDK